MLLGKDILCWQKCQQPEGWKGFALLGLQESSGHIMLEREGAVMEQCVFCRGAVDSATRLCQNCGREQPSLPAAFVTEAPPSQGMLTRRCPTCGEALPAQARFCGRCGQTLAPLPEPEEQSRARQGIWPLAAPEAGPGASVPSAAAGPQSGVPHVPYAPASPQSGAPSVPGAPAGPQSGVPNVPNAPAGPQSGAPHVPSTPGGTPGAQPIRRGAREARKAGKATRRGLRAKLLGTTAAKVITAIVAVAVVAATGVTVFAVTRPGTPQSHPASEEPHPTAQSSPGPNGAPPNNSSFTITTAPPLSSFYGPQQPMVLIVTRQAAPKGSTVCGPLDDGKPHTFSPASGVTDMVATMCSGSYQDGKVSYTQTLLSFQFIDDLSNGNVDNCTVSYSPNYTVHLEGSFTDATHISGPLTSNQPTPSVTCVSGGNSGSAPFFHVNSWSGVITSGPS